MLSLMPWKKERKGSTALATRPEYELGFFRNAMEEWFDRMFGRWPVLFENGEMFGYGLKVEETEEAVIVRADAPGFEPNEFTIEVRGEVLRIMAEHKEEGKGETPAIERRMHRELTLPAEVNAEKVEAKYRNGVLEIRLAKAAPSKTRRIEVKPA